MEETKMVLILCALGYATSSMMKKAVNEYFVANNIRNWSIETSAINMSQGLVKKANLIISSLDVGSEKFNVPVIDGVPLISGIGKEAVLKKIHEVITRADGYES